MQVTDKVSVLRMAWGHATQSDGSPAHTAYTERDHRPYTLIVWPVGTTFRWTVNTRIPRNQPGGGYVSVIRSGEGINVSLSKLQAECALEDYLGGQL